VREFADRLAEGTVESGTHRCASGPACRTLARFSHGCSRP
jgi:hypothetical protein